MYISAKWPINVAQKNELGTAWGKHKKWETYERFCLDKLMRRDNVYDVGMEGRISMKLISEKKMGRIRALEWIRSGQVRVNEK